MNKKYIQKSMIYKKALTVFMMVTVVLLVITCGCKKTLPEDTNSRNVDRSESEPLLSADHYLSPYSMAADENANLLYIVQSSAKKIATKKRKLNVECITIDKSIDTINI